MTWNQKWHRSRRALRKNDARMAVQLAEAKRFYEEARERGENIFWPYLVNPIRNEHYARFLEIKNRYPLT